MKYPLLLTVNDENYEILVEPYHTLMDAIRDGLGLTGTKCACEDGRCGACSVLLDGQLVKSCLVLALDAQGKSVLTIEGLGTPEALHVVQAAWVEHQVAQCGYCQSGQIMQAASFLELNPTPTDDQIDAAMSGNLCRCGTYPRIREAVKSAAIKLKAV